jgi:hypothetical protein
VNWNNIPDQNHQINPEAIDQDKGMYIEVGDHHTVSNDNVNNCNQFKTDNQKLDNRQYIESHYADTALQRTEGYYPQINFQGVFFDNFRDSWNTFLKNTSIHR